MTIDAGAPRELVQAGDALGLAVIERGWLSANQVVFRAHAATPATVVDTGYATHAEQTLALVDRVLAGERLGRIVNTHLHSDHCGGNAALQARAARDREGVPAGEGAHPGATLETWVPLPSIEAVRGWNDEALSYRYTGQRCGRFDVQGALVPGETIALGPAEWDIHAAPGHDMDAVMLFEPQTRTLISGDALWQERLAIIFPELVGRDGFGAARATLDLIESLRPRLVVPGHGAAFTDVEAALAASRSRLDAFERHPDRHLQHAARALVMYHLLEVRRSGIDALVRWMCSTPVFVDASRQAGLDDDARAGWAREVVEGLVRQGVVIADGDDVGVPANAS